MQEAQGDLPAALTSYRAAFAIRDRLARSDPGNDGWQRDLWISYNNIGDVQQAQGDLRAALTSYQAGFAIGDRLTKFDPGNAGWQRDLSFSYNNIGDVLVAQGNLPVALTSYQAGLAIRDRLAKSDPSNADWQRDLSFSVEKIGGMAFRLVLAHDFARALEAADVAISYAPDLTWLYTNRAHALMFLSRTSEARALYLKYRGQKDVEDGKSWENVILGDFAELQKAGLTRPLMTEIEKSFRAAG